MSKCSAPTPLHHAVIAERARCFRRHMNTEEAALWRELRGARLGVRFVRQRVVGPYIADFAAPSVKLIVEVDGECHALKQAADARRDRKLQRGWRVVRVSARRVMQELPVVVAEIEAALRVDTFGLAG